MAKAEEVSLFDQLDTRATEIFGAYVDPAIRYWLSTGIYLLDLGIRRNGLGIPGGRVLEIYGDEQTGKSTLAYLIGAQAQKAGGTVVLLDAEQRFSYDLAAKSGLSTAHNFIHRLPDSLEQACDGIERALDLWAKHDPDVPLVIIVDSVAVLGAKALDKSHEDEKYRAPSQALVWSWFYSKPIWREIAGTNTYVVLLNQHRDNVDFNNPGRGDKTPGGKVLKYMASVRIILSQTEIERKDVKLPGGGKVAIGQSIRATIRKTVGPPLRQVSFPYYYKIGFCDILTCVNYLALRKVITVVGGRYRFEGHNKFKLEWREAALADPGLYRRLREAVKETFWTEYGEEEDDD